MNFLKIPKLPSLYIFFLSLFLGLILSLGMISNPAYAGTKLYPSLEERIIKVIQDNPGMILESLQSYQEKQEQEKAEQLYSSLEKIKNEPQSMIGQSPVFGDKEAIALIEFSDFQCPYCGKASDIMDEFLSKHKDVKLVYKNLPLDFHAEALPAAKAAWAAGQQGKFWEFHHQLFAQQDNLGEPLYQSIAQNLSLDLPKFELDRASTESDHTIAQDIKLAETLGISGTPVFIMGGEILTGAVPISDLENVLASLQQKGE